MPGIKAKLKTLFRRKPKERVYKKKQKVTFSDVLDYIAITYFGKMAEKFASAFDLEKQLAQAGLQVYPMLYAARGLLYLFTSIFVSLYFILLMAVSPLPLALKVMAGIGLMLLPIFVLAGVLVYPAAKKEERKNNVETELPFFAAYLTTMARAGVSIARVIERVAALKIFKYIRLEASQILRDMRILGKSPLDAIEENAIFHPSTLYRDFMLGYVTSVKTGGDVLHYLEIRTQDIFNARMNQMKLIAERMSMFTEVYVTVAVIMTLVFYIFFTIQSIIPVGGLGGGGIAQLALFSFVFLPLMTVLLLYMVHSSQPKSPISYKAPYVSFLTIGIPAALLTFPIILYGTGAVSVLRGEPPTYHSIIALTVTLGAALIIMSLPPTIIYLREARKTRNLGEAMASFLRDLTEVRKTGLSPEKSILIVTARDYGALNPITKRLNIALTLGLHLEKAVRRAIRGYKDWLLIANFRFLVDSISVGGGTPETLESLARYAFSLTELDKEFKKRLRSYMFMPYMGAILVAASSILVLSFTGKSVGISGGTAGLGSSMGPAQIAKVALLLSLGATFNSYLMGIVAGKIQDGKVAAGFLHGIVLIIITIITVVVTLKGVPLTAAAQESAKMAGETLRTLYSFIISKPII